MQQWEASRPHSSVPTQTSSSGVRVHREKHVLLATVQACVHISSARCTSASLWARGGSRERGGRGARDWPGVVGACGRQKRRPRGRPEIERGKKPPRSGSGVFLRKGAPRAAVTEQIHQKTVVDRRFRSAPPPQGKYRPVQLFDIPLQQTAGGTAHRCVAHLHGLLSRPRVQGMVPLPLARLNPSCSRLLVTMASIGILPPGGVLLCHG
ncbi:hypothetical protein MRX96_002683 [Rhipicephalus microplus]